MLLRTLEVVLPHLSLDEENGNGLTSAILCITHGEKQTFLNDKLAYLIFFFHGLDGKVTFRSNEIDLRLVPSIDEMNPNLNELEKKCTCGIDLILTKIFTHILIIY